MRSDSIPEVCPAARNLRISALRTVHYQSYGPASSHPLSQLEQSWFGRG
jgi:hypothetical protein